jgi:uncharacterized protein (DUF362 family)
MHSQRSATGIPRSDSDHPWRDRIASIARAGLFRRRNRPYDATAFVKPRTSTVCVYPATDYSANFSALIVDGLAELGVSVAGRRILLKPNLVEYESGSVINTNPLVIAGAADACFRAGAREVVVGEGPGHRRDTEYLLRAAGLDDYLRDLRLQFVDLNHDDVTCVRLGSQFSTCREVWLPRTVVEADIVVSMPKLKTHHWAGMTASMKNLFGVVPGAVYGWPKNTLHIFGIANWIVAWTATDRPQLAIVDAVVGMEGDGPIMGTPRPLGFIAMGTDLVAVDATCARMIGIDPNRLPYLATAGAFLGHVDDSRIRYAAEHPQRFAAEVELLDDFQHLRLLGPRAGWPRC